MSVMLRKNLVRYEIGQNEIFFDVILYFYDGDFKIAIIITTSLY